MNEGLSPVTVTPVEKTLPPISPPVVITSEAYKITNQTSVSYGYGFGSLFSIPDVIHEPYAGAWQRNVIQAGTSILWHTVVYACVTRIQSDIGKLRIKLVQSDDGVIWTETENSSFSPVLRKQNRYQTHIDFKENWIGSKLVHGNTYVLKERDNANKVRRLYVLDPTRVHPLVTEDGEVLYQLSTDNLAGIEEDVAVPASEIIHDKYKPLYHPLVGVSPLRACAIAAMQALNIQTSATQFFANGSRPGGIITAPTVINPEEAEKLKRQWETGFSGANQGKVAVLGAGLKYEPFTVTAKDAELANQLKLTAEMICTAFGIPGFIVGIAPLPANTTPDIMLTIYYTLCLQNLIEHMELHLDEGLELPKPYGTELDQDNLLRMDRKALIETEAAAVKGALQSTNEGRRRLGYGPKPGGDDIRAQHQDYSIEALAERDANEPFAKPTPAVEPTPATPANNDEGEGEGEETSADKAIKSAALFGVSVAKELDAFKRGAASP